MNEGLSYIVPVYNEENGIAATIERLRAALIQLGIPYEIIIVNDGSRDQSRDKVEAIGGDDLRLISHPTNIGYGSALKSGIKIAKYEWIGIVDADGTYAIEALPLLVERMNQGFDMVVAARRNVLRLDKPIKRMFRRILIFSLNLLVGARIEDPNSGFRLFTKKLALTFFPFLCNTFSFTTSLTVFALGERFFVSYIPLDYSIRTGKSKVRHFRDSLRMMQLVLQGITFFNPIKFYLIMTLGFFIAFFIPSLFALALSMPWLSVLWLFSGALACVLVGLGVLADVIRISTLGRESV
ncbi:putative Undecaprenyl-phosphate 4-deoxy-4-formamido-L-arabinose transferase [Magnetospirillum gryphiswaldense MSR-1 v2]|uniref:Undecaprenyl-phosphate 4-deoxy-4-formamido-L-arabinose transferase n=1 Tax=Magnetospirillum gryphiswaldense (strain DSM 6361 / JCM 21280 / NBRC 15271 / MSR-1) TaxID=431944 RepID=V6F5F9_MAGGM|nr:glycosyltransferase family 2 protein [Magnetospirillum gryphiswaldense]CDL00679.1 putative Undecaprenyl-phosphate 4-deoxy-4-formamido-L-arabinose transferase [Magnetospirillum gryphiswaldense MSR-1 v2]